MSGLHRICCCGDPPTCDTCTGCFASSYVVSNLSGFISWEKSDLGPICAQCSGYDGGSNNTGYSVTLNITQGAWSALTRVGTTGCCYYAAGTFNVSYTVTITRVARCCLQEPEVTLETVHNYSGTTSTAGCLFVYPVCDFATGQCKFVHQLHVCSFPIQNVETMIEISDGDCQSGLEIGEEPLARYGLVVTGGCYVWGSPHKPLNLILSTEMVPGGWTCFSEAACGTCNWTEGNSTLNNGPFSLWFTEEWTIEPDVCVAPSGYIIGSWYLCGDQSLAKTVQPWFYGEVTTDCCYLNVGGGLGPPDYF